MRTKKTLTNDEIVCDRATSRRAALGTIALLAPGVAALAALPQRAAAKASDSDPTDPAGRGRTGFTDRDGGPGADGAGRGVCPERGWSDSDPNDPAGRGRGPCH